MRTGNQISIKIRCREDLVSPSHHLKSADHWLPLSCSLCLQSYCERISSPSQSSRAPDVLLWSPITGTEQWSSACQRMCVRSCCCCFFLFCLREFQITRDLKNWCHLFIICFFFSLYWFSFSAFFCPKFVQSSEAFYSYQANSDDFPLRYSINTSGSILQFQLNLLRIWEKIIFIF